MTNELTDTQKIHRIKKYLAMYRMYDKSGERSRRGDPYYTSPQCVADINDVVGGFSNAELEVQPLHTDWEAEYRNLIKRITFVFSRYYEGDINGDPSPNFDDCFTATEALDEIYNLVGGFKSNEVTPIEKVTPENKE